MESLLSLKRACRSEDPPSLNQPPHASSGRSANHIPRATVSAIPEPPPIELEERNTSIKNSQPASPHLLKPPSEDAPVHITEELVPALQRFFYIVSSKPFGVYTSLPVAWARQL